MNVRTTAQSQMNNVTAYLQKQSSALTTVLGQLSSGLRIQAPSDDPAGYVAVSQAKVQSGQFATYSQTMTDATSTLNAGVSALQDTNDIFTQAKQLAQQGANATTNPAGLKALADQVDSLVSRLVSTANTQFGSQYLFGGAASDAPPFEVTGTNAQGQATAVTYNGSGHQAQALIGPNQTVDTLYSGDKVFQKTGADAFQTLISLRDTLNNSSLSQTDMAAAMNQSLKDIDAVAGSIRDTTAQQSSSLVNLGALQSRVQDLKLAADTQVTNIGRTDYSSAIVQMQEQETAMQATLAVSARLVQPSLLSFIQ